MNQPKQKYGAAGIFRELNNPSAAWLYFHICYWWERPGGTEHRGHHWVFGNYDTWAEKTGMSYRQIQRNLSILRAKGWIESVQKVQGNGNVLLLRPRKKTTGLAADGQAVQLFEGTPVGLKGATHITKNHFKEPSKDTIPQPPSGASELVPKHLEKEVSGEEQDIEVEKEEESIEEEKMPPKAPHSVFDVAGMVAAKQKLHKPDTGPALGKVWQKGMKEHVPNSLVIISAKDMAMLKSFAKHCEPGTSEAILTFTLAEWIGFTKFCEQEAGAYKTPATPTLQFLVKYAMNAVTFYLQKQTKPVIATATPKPKPSNTQLIADAEPAQPKPTLDFLLAPIDPADALKD